MYLESFSLPQRLTGNLDCSMALHEGRSGTRAVATSAPVESFRSLECVAVSVWLGTNEC